MRTRIPAPVRFVATVLGLVLVFGGGTSLVLGAFDKSQTDGTAPLLNLGALWQYNLHFLQETVGVITTTSTAGGTPFRTLLLVGLATTIEFCFIAMPVALAFGFVLALMSRSERAILRMPARAYVEFFRNTPLLVQMLAIYYALPLPPWFLTLFAAGLATLILNYAAYECENLRTGLAALDRGQGEAASALGLSYWQTLRLITIPQMVSVVLPPVINDLIYMFKDSSILSFIAVTELTAQIKDLTRRSPSLSWQVFLVGALLYLALSLPLARIARAAEARLKSAAALVRRDLSVVALQAMGAMALIGWVCGLLPQGITLARIGASLEQLLGGLLLTTMLLAFMLLTLGGIVYGIYRLLSLRPARAPSTPVAGPTAPVLAAEP
jgi:glutamine transport system permease protein